MGKLEVELYLGDLVKQKLNTSTLKIDKINFIKFDELNYNNLSVDLKLTETLSCENVLIKNIVGED